MSLALLRLRVFRHLLIAYGVSQLGDFAAEIGLAVTVFAATGSAGAVREPLQELKRYDGLPIGATSSHTCA
jgi:hypothetical protein